MPTEALLQPNGGRERINKSIPHHPLLQKDPPCHGGITTVGGRGRRNESIPPSLSRQAGFTTKAMSNHTIAIGGTIAPLFHAQREASETKNEMTYHTHQVRACVYTYLRTCSHGPLRAGRQLRAAVLFVETHCALVGQLLGDGEAVRVPVATAKKNTKAKVC